MTADHRPPTRFKVNWPNVAAAMLTTAAAVWLALVFVTAL